MQHVYMDVITTLLQMWKHQNGIFVFGNRGGSVGVGLSRAHPYPPKKTLGVVLVSPSL